jgi:hypothetical protein
MLVIIQFHSKMHGPYNIKNTECLLFCYRNMHSKEQLEWNKCLYMCLSMYKCFNYYIRHNSPSHTILIMGIISLHAQASSIHTELTTPLPSISHTNLHSILVFPSLLPAVKTQTTLVTFTILACHEMTT